MFFGIPVLMVASLVWLGVRHLRDKSAQAAAVESGAWAMVPAEDGQLQAALADLELSHGAIAGAWQAPPILVVDWSHASKGADPELRTGQRRRLIIAPRHQAGPRGVASRKGGGMLEAAAEGVARQLGATPLQAPGWEWARVAGPDGTFLSAEVGAAVDTQVGPGERLHLGARHIALSLPEGPMGPVLDTAAARVDALQAALGG